MFDFRYRIDIHVPQHKRTHGYYVLPFPLDEAFVARVDLKADHQAEVLRALRVTLEPGAPAETVERLSGCAAQPRCAVDPDSGAARPCEGLPEIDPV